VQIRAALFLSGFNGNRKIRAKGPSCDVMTQQSPPQTNKSRSAKVRRIVIDESGIDGMARAYGK